MSESPYEPKKLPRIVYVSESPLGTGPYCPKRIRRKIVKPEGCSSKKIKKR